MLFFTSEMKDHFGNDEGFCAEQRKQRIELRTINEHERSWYDAIRYDPSIILSGVFSSPAI